MQASMYLQGFTCTIMYLSPATSYEGRGSLAQSSPVSSYEGRGLLAQSSMYLQQLSFSHYGRDS